MGTGVRVSTAFVYEVEPRFSVDLGVTIVLHGSAEGAGRVETRMLNFSRRGFCVATQRLLIPGNMLSLELWGWPPIVAHIAWSRDARAGCQLVEPLDDHRFDAMLLSVEAIDRAGEWNL